MVASGALTTPYDEHHQFVMARWQGDHGKVMDRVNGVVQKLLESRSIVTGNHAVDLCCGPAFVTKKLADTGWKVIGVDASIKMVQEAKKILGPVLHGDATDTHLPEGQFDLVLSTMSHSDVPDWSALVQEAERLLTRGGFFLYTGLHPNLVPPLREDSFRNKVGYNHLSLPELLRPVLDLDLHMCDFVEEGYDQRPPLVGFTAQKL